MDPVLWSAKTNLDAHHQAMAVISNNLANASTTAFKKNRPQFEDLGYQNIVQPGSATSGETNANSGIMIGTGVRLADTTKIFMDGSQTQTGNSLDLAISGRGFFQIQVPNTSEYAYSRAGNFQLNAQGQLVLPNGYLLQPPITIPTGAQKISISHDGIVSVVDAVSGQSTQVGQLTLTDFINPAGLEPMGENLYRATSSSGTPTAGTPATNGMGKLYQGALESSNVNVVEEMMAVIEEQRLFEMGTKVVAADEEMLKKLDDELR